MRITLLFAGLVWLLLASTAGAQDPTGTTLELSLPSEGTTGEGMVVDAHLTDETGSPVADAEVVFQWELEFMNTGGTLELGGAITDEHGVATLSFVPRSEGEMVVTARFDGDDQHGLTSDTGTVTVQAGPPLYEEEAGVRVPGINVSLLAGVLGTVWSIYFVVMVLVWLIARDGAELPPSREMYRE